MPTVSILVPRVANQPRYPCFDFAGTSNLCKVDKKHERLCRSPLDYFGFRGCYSPFLLRVFKPSIAYPRLWKSVELIE
jgi:hypothetical protein